MISDIQQGNVSDVFLVSDVKFLRTQDKRWYTLFEFKDRTGTIKGFIWSKKIDFVKSGDFVKLTCQAEIFKGEMVLRINESSIMKTQQPECLDNYIRSLDKLTINKLWEELLGIVNAVQDKDYKLILNTLIESGGEHGEFNLRNCPIENYCGELLEHIVYCCRLAKSIQRNYFDRNTPIDPDLLIAICILQPLGNLERFDNLLTLNPSEKSTLLSTAMMAFSFASKLVAKCGLMEDSKFLRLLHGVLSCNNEESAAQFTEVKLARYIVKMDRSL